MCGIAGIMHLRGEPVADGLVERMRDTLEHRGPDDHGVFGLPHARIGHRRLSIIDLAHGHQPLLNEDGQIAVVVNGEIYNFRELRRDLESRGHRFRTGSDSEVVVHLYEEYGEHLVDHLRGMYAFALVDSRTGSLLLGRDRLGIKPLYYAQVGETLLFGSELKAILAHPEFPREVDPEALLRYLCLRYVPAPQTIYAHARKLPAGHRLVARPGEGVRVERYWDIEEMGTDGGDLDSQAEAVRASLEESVAMRLVADVPLGAFLSGGLDSSGVVAAMSRLQEDPVKTCTVGFDDRDHDESAFAARLAERFHADHRSHDATADPLLALTTLPWFFDEPFADSSSVPTYLVSRLARERVTVALSGDGGDENFAGYRRYPFDALENRLRSRFPGFLRRSLIAGLAALYPKGDFLPQRLRAKTLLSNLARDPFEAYARSVAATAPEEVRSILSESLRERLKDVDPFLPLREHYDRAPSRKHLEKVLYMDIKTYLVDDILTKVDRASMAVALEVRVPLLDHVFVERAARIPIEHKLQGMRGKVVLKRALEAWLDRETIDRKKHGFTVPLKRWTQEDLAPEIVRAIERAPEEWFDRAALRRVFERHRAGRRDHSELLWAILMFDAWHGTHHLRSTPRGWELERDRAEVVCGS